MEEAVTSPKCRGLGLGRAEVDDSMGMLLALIGIARGESEQMSQSLHASTISRWAKKFGVPNECDIHMR